MTQVSRARSAVAAAQSGEAGADDGHVKSMRVSRTASRVLFMPQHRGFPVGGDGCWVRPVWKGGCVTAAVVREDRFVKFTLRATDHARRMHGEAYLALHAGV